MSYTKVKCDQCGKESCTTEWHEGMRRCYDCRQKNERLFRLFVIVLVLTVVVGSVSIPPYMEMRTFNKFSTGTKATYWDAVFSDLRIMPK